MSERNDQAAFPSEAIRDRAADWLWRQQQSGWSEGDQAAFNDWMDQSRHHLVAYWRLKAAWSRTERLAALKPARMRDASASANTRGWSKLRLAAAGLCAIAALGAAGAYFGSDHKVQYTTSFGQRSTIALADGSQIELNTNSAVTVDMGLLARRVQLSRGEAFFRVHHDSARPFTVYAAHHRITGLGTQFSVRKTGDRLEVTLIEGRARLEAAGLGVQRHATDLTPGEVAVATADSLTVSRLPTRTIANTLAWRTGKVVFSHVTLAQAAGEFNRYNDTRLIVAPDAADLKVSGTFDAVSVGPFTAMARLAFGLQINRDGNNIILSRDSTDSGERRN